MNKRRLTEITLQEVLEKSNIAIKNIYEIIDTTISNIHFGGTNNIFAYLVDIQCPKRVA